jgi:F0F1-type ATP synthase delta subunit
MEARGHQQLLPRVLRAVIRERSASRAIRTVVRVNDEASYQALKQEIVSTLTELQATEEPAVIIDSTLIGGYQVEANAIRVDASYKQQLRSLYRSITNFTT